MVDLAGVPPIVAAEDMDEAQEDIDLVYQRLVGVGMSSGYLLAAGVNAVAHSPGDTPVVGGMQDVKGPPSVPSVEWSSVSLPERRRSLLLDKYLVTHGQERAEVAGE